MSDAVFLFSGQGAQYPGMGYGLYQNNFAARLVYEQASQVLGMDLLALSMESTKEQLAQTGLSQPLIFTLSMAAFAVLEANSIGPAAVAGFSLGECSALAAAGAMTLETGLTVIKARADAMQRASDAANGAMVAVLGLPSAAVAEECEKTEGYAVPVNFNCPGQTVIAGDEKAVLAAAASLKALGAKTVRLAVSSAFHSALMESASREFYEKIADIRFAKPKVPVYSNVTGGLLDEAAPAETGKAPDGIDLAGYLRRQMVSPVRFEQEMETMKAAGYTRFIELGPGKTLCGFIRRGIRGAETYNIQDMESADACFEAFQQN